MSKPNKPQIGFIGIGVMGDPMVRNLLKAGYAVTVYDRVKAKMAGVVKAGATSARSSAELAAGADIVIVMVDTTDSVRKALFGKRGVWETIRPGSTVIIMSTIDPYFCQEVAGEAKKKGISYLDVPVSGAGEPVRQARVALLCGGDKAVLKKHKAMLMTMGNKVFHMGGPGMGEVAKICNNYIGTVTGAVLGDVIRMASRAGLDLELLREALAAGSANSASLQRNWHQLAREAVRPGTKVERHFPTILYKDVGLAMALARKHGLFVPLAGVTSQLDLSRWMPAHPKRD